MKYICEVNKDNKNVELELVRDENILPSFGSATEGAIKFSNIHQMNKYFNKHCISANQLQNNGNNLFIFLFFILLLIFIITLVCQMFNNSNTGLDYGLRKTEFGRFSF
jgi:hypothetical protein